MNNAFLFGIVVGIFIGLVAGLLMGTSKDPKADESLLLQREMLRALQENNWLLKKKRKAEESVEKEKPNESSSQSQIT